MNKSHITHHRSLITDQSSLKKKLSSESKKIAITTHFKPDGDAMGSSLALYHYLKLKGHKPIVVTPSNYPKFLHFLPGNDEVISFEKSPRKAKKAINDAEIIFALDFNDLKRIQDLAEIVEKSKATKVMIDHHLHPADFANFELSVPEASSTAELIVDFMELMGDKKLLNKEIAACIYTGIMTDTGSFRFPSTSAKVHRIVADLIETGLEKHKIHEAVYDSYSENRLKFLGYCLSEKLRILRKQKIAYFAVTEEELIKYNSQPGDTEGLVNYALAIEGIQMACLMIDRNNLRKLSFRSKGDVFVNEFASKNFNGGGHKYAAGGTSELSLEATEEKFLKLVKQF